MPADDPVGHDPEDQHPADYQPEDQHPADHQPEDQHPEDQHPEDHHPEDHDPEDLDPGLARERTRLAWARTAIAFAAVGAVVVRKDVLDGMIVLAGAPLIWAIGRFAVRQQRPEQASARLLVVTLSVIVAAVLATLVAFLGHSPASLDEILPRHG